VGHGEPIVRPKASHELDWEAELAVIIGEGGRHIAEKDAMRHVAGYSCYNDVSVREWQFHAKQIAAGKNFVGTGPFGPWMVTADEIPDPENLKLELRINGKTEQSSSTRHLIFKIPAIISYCSTIFDLAPGDVLVTGTPAGVGWSRKPPQFLQPGDVVEVEIEKIGVLRNPVVDE
jgi:2-keto-4-pentenoate hydratase/2-oxohepta-3-ene-1,7-dioic acid hydratase in catechol pathway